MKLFYYFLCCLIPLHAQSQNLIEKWEITPLKKVTTGKGRLDLRFPGDVEWSVDVYNSSNKFITNRSIKDQRNVEDKKDYFELPAGTYKLKLNTVIVENVPIEEGKLTRLKSGSLNIKNPGRWELRNESGKKFYTSGNIQKNLALPVGKYQVKEGAGVRIVDIIDQFSKTEEIENTLPVQTPLLEIKEDHSITPGMSRVVTVIPDFGPVNLPAGGTINFPEIKCELEISSDKYVFSCKETPKEIEPGNRYTRVNRMPLGVITYEADKQTRLKLGFLPISLKGRENEFAGLENYFELGEVPGSSYKSWRLQSLNNNERIEETKGGIYAFPAGEYILTMYSEINQRVTFNVTISDGKFAIIKKRE